MEDDVTEISAGSEDAKLLHTYQNFLYNIHVFLEHRRYINLVVVEHITGMLDVTYVNAQMHRESFRFLLDLSFD